MRARLTISTAALLLVASAKDYEFNIHISDFMANDKQITVSVDPE